MYKYVCKEKFLSKLDSVYLSRLPFYFALQYGEFPSIVILLLTGHANGYWILYYFSITDKRKNYCPSYFIELLTESNRSGVKSYVPLLPDKMN